MSTITEYVRTCLRRTSTTLDEEIETLISACKSDLRKSGVNVDEMEDDSAELRTAAEFFCKARFGYNNESEKYWSWYTEYRDGLASSTEFGVHVSSSASDDDTTYIVAG